MRRRRRGNKVGRLVMSDNEGGESKSLGAFLLGFLTGVLVCLGIGGALFFVTQRNVLMERQRAAEMEEVARMEAESARDAEMHARMEAEKAEKALREATKEKDKKDR
jgi:hypothetical protein